MQQMKDYTMHQFELDLDRIVLVNGTDFMKFIGLRVKRFNKTVFALQGKVKVEQNFDKTWSVSMDVWRSKLNNNQWEMTPMKVAQQTACSFIDNVYKPQMQDDLRNVSTFPYYNKGDPTCPFIGVIF